MEQPGGGSRHAFGRYSESSNLTLFYSRAALSEHGGVAIEPTHLLLGLLQADANATGAVLTPAPTLHMLSECLVSTISSPDLLGDDVEVPFGADTSKILTGAEALAAEFSHETIAPEHLLLALLVQAEGAVMACLKSAGVDMTRTIEKLRQRLSGRGRSAV